MNTYGFDDETDESLKEIAEKSDKRFDMLYNKIMPFLRNLQKNPEQDVIKWKTRVADVTKFVAEIEAIRKYNEE